MCELFTSGPVSFVFTACMIRRRCSGLRVLVMVDRPAAEGSDRTVLGRKRVSSSSAQSTDREG